MEKRFEEASRKKYRFSYKGLSTVEDLWDIPFTGLDKIFKELNSEMKTVKEESLLETKNAEDKELECKIEIVKYVYEVRKAEREALKDAKERKEKKQKLMEIYERKEEESIEKLSKEEIMDMINAL